MTYKLKLWGKNTDILAMVGILWYYNSIKKYLEK